MSWPNKMPIEAITSSSIAFIMGVLVTLFISARPNKLEAQRRIIDSPRETLLPYLSPSQIESLPYPPDYLPGARDVETPYGTMRVYEWGPEDGRKVVLIHGDTTPAPMLGPLAAKLVASGCRVIVLGMSACAE